MIITLCWISTSCPIHFTWSWMFEQVKFWQIPCDLHRSSPKLFPFCQALSFSVSENVIFFTLLEGSYHLSVKISWCIWGEKQVPSPFVSSGWGILAAHLPLTHVYSPSCNNMHQDLRAVGFWGYASAMKTKLCQAGFGSWTCSSLISARKQL